jgi:hypothetical protein
MFANGEPLLLLWPPAPIVTGARRRTVPSPAGLPGPPLPEGSHTMNAKPKKREFTVLATVRLRGASMEVMAHDEDEAREIAMRAPDFDFGGAEMTDWSVYSVREN